MNNGESESYNFNQIDYLNFGDANIAVTSLELSENSATIATGETLTIEYSIFPDNATNQTVVWGSSDMSVATVDENGVVSAWTPGTVSIIGISQDGEFQDILELTVTDVSSVGISEDNINIFPNPVGSRLVIDVKNQRKFEVILSNVSGHQIYAGYDQNEIDMSRWNSGTYFVTIIMDGEYFNYKIIKN